MLKPIKLFKKRVTSKLSGTLDFTFTLVSVDDRGRILSYHGREVHEEFTSLEIGRG